MGGKGKEPRTKELEFHSSQDWEKTKDLPGMIIVDVYTKWAGPCNIMKPIINKMKVQVIIIQ